jgi:hypothetical protein
MRRSNSVCTKKEIIMFKNLVAVVIPLCLTALSLNAQSPSVDSLAPTSGSGGAGTFTFVASDPNGVGDLNSLAIVVNSSLSASQSCYARYFPATNQVFLQNDAGTAWASHGPPGAASGIGNKQCWINLQSSSVSSGSNLTVTLAISFQPNFNGAKNVWIEAHDNEDLSSGWQQLGAWTAQPQINLAAPVWTQVMTSSLKPEYLKYDSSGGIEHAPAQNPDQFLPHDFLEPASADTNNLLSGVCKFPDANTGAPPFWFVKGVDKSGQAKDTNPSEFYETPFSVPGSAYTDIGFGLQFRGSFGGQASVDGYLFETAYVHQQPCYAGQLEYGFYRDMVAASATTVFYFSNNSNCGDPGNIKYPPLCHVADDINSDFIYEDTAPGGTSPEYHGVNIDNLKVNNADATYSNLYYSVYIVPDLSALNGYRFQVEVFDPAAFTLATCDATAADPAVGQILAGQLCSFPYYPGAWFRIDQLYSTSAVGYATVGIQRGGTPTVGVTVDFHVDQLSVGKK